MVGTIFLLCTVSGRPAAPSHAFSSAAPLLFVKRFAAGSAIGGARRPLLEVTGLCIGASGAVSGVTVTLRAGPGDAARCGDLLLLTSRR